MADVSLKSVTDREHVYKHTQLKGANVKQLFEMAETVVLEEVIATASQQGDRQTVASLLRPLAHGSANDHDVLDSQVRSAVDTCECLNYVATLACVCSFLCRKRVLEQELTADKELLDVVQKRIRQRERELANLLQ